MAIVKTGKPKGILNPNIGEQKFALTRYVPDDNALGFFIEHYWIVKWDLRGEEPYPSENLPYPSVHLVFQQDHTQIYGVIRGKFTRYLTGQGQVLGVKFRPGAFYPFVKTPVAQFTDDAICLEDVFGVATEPLEKAILSRTEDGQMVELVEHFLRGRLPERDETITQVNRIIDRIVADRSITKVDDLLDHLDMNKRTLQRLFNQYVGVSPKWVIQRSRLHEATEQLARGDLEDCVQMALNLGYFDQAHFIKDFKMLVGQSPLAYAKQVEFE
ncbi:MAG: AraC family transcriptional regulator [Chloroflexota bacterium]